MLMQVEQNVIRRTLQCAHKYVLKVAVFQQKIWHHQIQFYTNHFQIILCLRSCWNSYNKTN